MKSGTYKPYTAPGIEVAEVVLESTVLQLSPKISDLEEDDEEFVW